MRCSVSLGLLGLSLQFAVALVRGSCSWECSVWTGRLYDDSHGTSWKSSLRVHCDSQRIILTVKRSTEWLQWTLTPQWSCSCDDGVLHWELRSDKDSWDRCKAWHFQPDVSSTESRFLGFRFFKRTGGEDHRREDGRPFSDPPSFVRYRDHAWVSASTWLALAILAMYPTIAFIRGPVRRWRRRRKGLCIGCGYDLTGNVSGVCSECGREITKP